ncbi:hypothetical protein QOZ80_5AG0406490 [Eleusine coracana subsp. coracana]|nr:hypothetical protein QOZ80_5AG0406490 [Eleusine coracana subsp. coracana]
MAPPPPPPELMEDAVGEILLCLPPDDPALLLRASLVCKPWRRLLTDPAFLRRYHAFHQTPPLLGFLRNADDYIARFVPTASFLPQTPDHRYCRHGRVLLYVHGRDYIVWDPITGDEQHVPDADIPLSYFNAAVMCAAGAGCDHRDCHGGPFLVALVGTDEHEWVTYASLYSSESGEWCEPSELEFEYYVEMLPPVLAGGAMSRYVGVFAIGLKSRWIRKVSEGRSSDYAIFPYTSFFIPGHAIERPSALSSNDDP